MLSESELQEHDAVGLAKLIAERQVTVEEVLEATLSVLDRINPVINAVIADLRSDAARAAQLPLPDSPLAGVPFLVKNLGVDIAGAPSTYGSRFFADRVTRQDGPLVTRYRAAGLLLLGLTNTPEFGLNPSTEPVLYGATRNPWNLKFSTGGSSGGSAAAVAARIVPAAHGGDGGGSIRTPSSCCGLFGLKPSRGRNAPGTNDTVDWSGYGTEHALTRTVRDSAALLDAASGGRQLSSDGPADSFLSQVGKEPGRLRIAFTRDSPSGSTVNPAGIAAVTAAAKLCERLGHDVVEAAPAYDAEAFTTSSAVMNGAKTAALIDRRTAELGREPGQGDLEAVTRLMVDRARELTGPQLAAAIETAQRMARDAATFFDSYDVFLTPTMGGLPPVLGLFNADSDDFASYIEAVSGHVPFTMIWNATGQPAMSVPLHWSESGLPVGVQFVGRRNAEDVLLRLAGQLETAAPWGERRPALIASE